MTFIIIRNALFYVSADKEILFSTGILFIHFFILSGVFPKGSIFPADFVKFKGISSTGKMNLLYSNISKALSARTYNDEGSDARIRNQFVNKITDIPQHRYQSYKEMNLFLIRCLKILIVLKL